MKYQTILFTTMDLRTAAIVVVVTENGQTNIVRHAAEASPYTHAYLLGDNGFQPLHYSEAGMEVQDAINHLP